MLSEDQVKKALHASRVLPLGVVNPHGPLGLEQVAEAVSRLHRTDAPGSRVERPIALPMETWEKLDELARHVSKTSCQSLSASDLAVAILENAMSEN